MPTPLRAPQQWGCSKCDWQQTVVIKSDVLLPKPDKCPKCGEEVKLKTATLLSRIHSLFQSYVMF